MMNKICPQIDYGIKIRVVIRLHASQISHLLVASKKQYEIAFQEARALKLIIVRATSLAFIRCPALSSFELQFLQIEKSTP